ncbi:MAG: 3(2), 5-bisphosphate nucleotidase [Methylobacteriaceae bacterium]|jgi:3'(2'),5'-bisphosphate nucleotidase|nr:3(2), 5-bisphosphate nucleotidase [Methylobacteriaceae bacterium]
MDLGPIQSGRPGLSYDQIAEILADIALQAGPAIMRVYERRDPGARMKPDRSPVCEADELAEQVILDALSVRLPQWRVIAEESASRGIIPICGRGFLLVDPLDGTKEFLDRNGEFTVNIALIVDGTPRAGAVYAPALGKLWFGGERAYACDAKPGAPLPGTGDRRELHVRSVPSADIIALTSRSHLEAETEGLLSALPVGQRRAIGSSIKFCLIAEGLADFYPRFGPTMEWDVAAGEAVLRAAGGLVLSPEGEPPCYGKKSEGYRSGSFIAWGGISPERAAEHTRASARTAARVH